MTSDESRRPTDADAMRRAIGARITAIRSTRHMSLSALARAAGIGKGSLSELESGQRNPTLDTLYAVAGPLQVPLTALLGEESGTEGSDGSLSARLLHVEHLADGTLIEVFWLRIIPGGERISPAHSPGTRESIYLAEGDLTAGPLDAQESASAGQTLAWLSDVTHAYRSTTGAAGTLTITTPPTHNAAPGDGNQGRR